MNTTLSLQDDSQFKVLRLLQNNPKLNQRDIAQILGYSLGKTNYCVKALLDKGWLKMQNFLGSNNKLAYSYLLTPTGISEKSQMTSRFLQRKVNEYEALQLEIALLRREVNSMTTEAGT